MFGVNVKTKNLTNSECIDFISQNSVNKFNETVMIADMNRALLYLDNVTDLLTVLKDIRRYFDEFNTGHIKVYVY